MDPSMIKILSLFRDRDNQDPDLGSVNGKHLSTLSKIELVAEFEKRGLNADELCRIGGIEPQQENLCRLLHFQMEVGSPGEATATCTPGPSGPKKKKTESTTLRTLEEKVADLQRQLVDKKTADEASEVERARKEVKDEAMKGDGANMENGLKLRPWEMDVTISFNTTSQDVRSNSWVNFHGAAFPFGEMIEMPSAEQAFQQAMADNRDVMQEYHSTEDIVTKRRLGCERRCVLITVIVVGVAAFVIGILIGRFATCPDEEPEERDGVFLPGVPKALVEDGDASIGDTLINNIVTENIRNNLKMLTEKPHLAGTEENHELGRKLMEFWEDAGLDHVTMSPYDVLLSYPNMSDLNYVELLDGSGTVQYKSDLYEPILTPEENKTNVVPPFNAFSGHGDIKGDLVYLNYGRVEDYAVLANHTNITVSGKIVIARYGKIFRGDKVHIAEMHGAIGIILFSDPADVTGGDINQTYPHDWWLPPSGAQRGTVFIGDGDPLTPDYPAIGTAYREDEKNTTFYLPSIPSHPIGYGIAIKLMRQLSGADVPSDWQGGMKVTYKFGGEFVTAGWQAHIHVSTHNKRVTTYNVMGIIRGQVEPDRYVLVGNHRDAWVFGALDPSSGTAAMMEISRVMGELVKTGKWRPRRSIIFCSWGAEEYGLVGSTEWVEHYTKVLGARAIAYLNVDIAVEGNVSLRALGTPLIYQSLFAAAKRVPNPNPDEVAAGRTTVYDTWFNTFPEAGTDRPVVTLPGSGSDYAPFRDRIGVPCVDIRYTWNSNKLNISSYPLYHSVYETFYAVDEIMDKEFKYHTALGQVWVEMARNLADSLILPFNVSNYASVLEGLGKSLFKDYGTVMRVNGIDNDLLMHAIANFTASMAEFENSIKTANLKDPFSVRRINDQLMQLDRAFLDPAGLPDRELKRHILFAESSVDNYAGSSFPGIVDAIFAIENGDKGPEHWEVVKKHYSVILFTIDSAISTLKDVTDFMYSY